jgi:hypothetical protein
MADEALVAVVRAVGSKGGHSLKLFTTLATLGTPQDITAQEIRIECFFPADAATAALFKEWAAANAT